MRARTILLGVAVALAATSAWAAQPTNVRPIDVSEFNLGYVRWDNVFRPVVISDPDQLARLFRDESVASTINGQVDFDKEIVLYFRWEGSGLDRLHPTRMSTADGVVTTFILRPGATVDLTSHHQLFAIPKNANWRVEAAIGAN